MIKCARYRRVNDKRSEYIWYDDTDNPDHKVLDRCVDRIIALAFPVRRVGLSRETLRRMQLEGLKG